MNDQRKRKGSLPEAEKHSQAVCYFVTQLVNSWWVTEEHCLSFDFVHNQAEDLQPVSARRGLKPRWCNWLQQPSRLSDGRRIISCDDAQPARSVHYVKSCDVSLTETYKLWIINELWHFDVNVNDQFDLSVIVWPTDDQTKLGACSHLYIKYPSPWDGGQTDGGLMEDRLMADELMEVGPFLPLRGLMQDSIWGHLQN